VTTAIINAEQREHLAAQANTDPLTGLANHRAFHERLRGEVDRALRHGRALSLVVIDVDAFKGVNDSAGHAAGDRVLAEVATRLRASPARATCSPGSAATSSPGCCPRRPPRTRTRRSSAPARPVASAELAGGQRITISGRHLRPRRRPRRRRAVPPGRRRPVLVEGQRPRRGARLRPGVGP
jgi:hypothetical protein